MSDKRDKAEVTQEESKRLRSAKKEAHKLQKKEKELKEKEKMAEDHQKVRSRPHHRQISLTIVSACKQVQA